MLCAYDDEFFGYHPLEANEIPEQIFADSFRWCGDFKLSADYKSHIDENPTGCLRC